LCRDHIDTASVEEKHELLELFDVRGKLAIEDNEKVVHITCLLVPLLPKARLILHSSNRQQQYSIELTVRLVLGAELS
jgi:hypothetical protein